MVHSEPLINSYMYDIGNLRSHHWRYWMDIYRNCAYDCQYCVYRSGKMGRVEPTFDDLEAVISELEAIQPKGILYLGPKADIYQPVEKRLGHTRLLLQALRGRRQPIFVITRSLLIKRDFDLLEEFAAEGMVEISVTIASPGDRRQMEPNTPSVDQRLELVYELSRRGIPASVHLSPIIPNLDPLDTIKDLMQRMRDAGAVCIYACMLGMSDRYYDDVKTALADNPAADLLDEVYAQGNRRLDIFSARQDYVMPYMRSLAEFSSSRAIPFACVHIPEFDTVERTGHIFRFKLPNIGDMVRHFARIGKPTIVFNDLVEYLGEFPAVDDEFVDMVKRFWNEGVLFKNTYLAPDSVTAPTSYSRKNVLDLAVTNMRVGAQ